MLCHCIMARIAGIIGLTTVEFNRNDILRIGIMGTARLRIDSDAFDFDTVYVHTKTPVQDRVKAVLRTVGARNSEI